MLAGLAVADAALESTGTGWSSPVTGSSWCSSIQPLDDWYMSTWWPPSSVA